MQKCLGFIFRGGCRFAPCLPRSAKIRKKARTARALSPQRRGRGRVSGTVRRESAQPAGTAARSLELLAQKGRTRTGEDLPAATARAGRSVLARLARNPYLYGAEHKDFLTMEKQWLLPFLLCAVTAQSGPAQTVEPLVAARFSQTAPYNDACPEQSAAGCGPVALAQILAMYRAPAHGYGSVAYACPGLADSVRADFGRMTFDWDNVRDDYKGGYSAAEAAAVAQLVYACGAATYARYGPSTSIGNYALMLYGMQHFLHFSPESRYLHRQFYSTAEWVEMLNDQLRAGHPVFYRGSWLFDGDEVGHMFVVDGLDADGRYHVNFGHGGTGDKYVDLGVINQNGTYPGGRAVCYNATQAMVVNCYPTPGETEYPEQRCVQTEPVVLNGDSTLRSVEVELGQTVQLSALLRNCSGARATVNYGWGLERDGELLEMLTQSTFSLGAGNRFTGRRHRTVRLPAGLENGAYRLALYSCSEAEPEWAPVWADARPWADLYVYGNRATVTVPERHDGDPRLYLSAPVCETAHDLSGLVPGRVFALQLRNETANNFQDTVRLEIEAGGHIYIYKAVLPVYSQTAPEFRVLVPQARADLAGKAITAVRAAYRLAPEGRYVPLTTERPTAVDGVEAGGAEAGVAVYSLQGVLLGRIPAGRVATDYGALLNGLPHGVYVVKEGRTGRKVLR